VLIKFIVHNSLLLTVPTVGGALLLMIIEAFIWNLGSTLGVRTLDYALGAII